MGQSSTWIGVILAVILIFINGVLASAEMALVGLNETKLRKKSVEGDKKAAFLLHMKENPSDFLSAVQVGITLAGLLSGAFAADSLAEPIVKWIETLGASRAIVSVAEIGAVVFITLLLTYAMLVFGELVPKRIAMKDPENTASRSIPPIWKLSILTRPLVKLLSASTNGILKLMGIDPKQHETPITEEEILLMLREGYKQGAIEQSEVEIVSNLFEFTDLSAEDAMTHRTEIKAVSPEDSISDVVSMMSKTSYSKFPVIDGSMDKIIGVVYSQDIVKLLPFDDNVPLPSVREVMQAPHFVHESKSLVEIFNEMKLGKNRLTVVVDEYGGTSGIITLTDIIEKIVGTIEMDYLTDIHQNEDGSYTMDGTIDMDDVCDFLGIAMEPEEHDTLSGFIIHELGYIPENGQTPTIEYAGYSFKAAKMQGALIKLVNVRKIPNNQ
ncbi:MAG: HlyC/CorC family transporter [Clostridiales bacterium]|nr:HlyC/CorC family transporter [Clostridiales bacterium]